MRTGRIQILTGLAIAGVLALAPACSDSNTMTGPSMVAATNVAGTWTGTYQSDSSACPSGPVTVTLQQSGADLTGRFETAASCGPNGVFKGHVQGSQVTGNIEMLGCTGGGVSGSLSGSGLTLAVGDLYRPLVTGNAVVMEGGSAALSR